MDLRKLLMDVADRADLERDYMLRDLVANYRIRVLCLEQDIPHGPYRYLSSLGSVSGWEGALEVLSRHQPLPAPYAEEVSQLKAKVNHLYRGLTKELLELDRPAGGAGSPSKEGAGVNEENQP